jgi:hypothetical protein
MKPPEKWLNDYSTDKFFTAETLRWYEKAGLLDGMR